MSGMGVPYESPPLANLQVNGGSSVCFPCPFPNRSSIRKIIAKQTSGVDVNFTVALYSRQVACDGDSVSMSVENIEDEGLCKPDNFRVTDDLAGTAGSLIWFAERDAAGLGFDFFSQEPTPAGNAFVRQQTIWVKITAQGSGLKAFCVTLGGRVYQ